MANKLLQLIAALNDTFPVEDYLDDLEAREDEVDRRLHEQLAACYSEATETETVMAFNIITEAIVTGGIPVNQIVAFVPPIQEGDNTQWKVYYWPNITFTIR
jgi:predicted P-loop ATPase